MILIGTDNGIYRWFEGCGWPIFHGLQGRAIVGLASPGAGVLVALGREGQVFESLNNGQEWRTIPLAEGSGTPTSLAVWGQPPVVVLATRPPAFYRRAIGAPVPLAEEPVAVSPGLAPALLHRARTLAGGASAMIAPRAKPARVDARTARQAGWTRLEASTLGKAAPGAEIRAQVFGGGTPSSWYAAVRRAGLWRSLDGGLNWQGCPGLSGDVLALRTSWDRPGSLYAATADGCWISPDGGQTWEDRSGGLEGHRYVGALTVKPGAPDVLLAGAAPKGPDSSALESTKGLAFSLFESSNGGKTWTLVRRGNPDVFADDAIADIRHDPAAPDSIIMALASGELWVTRNGGAFWTPLARQIRAARALCAVA